jgi:phosphoserine phosphatase
VTGAAGPVLPSAGSEADLVVQAPDLAAEAIAAFRERFPAARLRQQTASVRFEGVGSAAEVATSIAALARTWRCDATLVPPRLELSGFRVLALDMDSTLIRIECLDELAQLAGVGPEVAAITEAAMRGEIADYSDSLKRRVALLAGVDASLMNTVAQQRLQLSAGAEPLIRGVRQAGLRTLLVTGGFEFFARILQHELGIDAVCANDVQTRDGRLTGVVYGPGGTTEGLVDASGKANALRQACFEAGCSTTQAIAIGDGANDLPMLALAGIGVAYHAKPRVRESAGYSLNYSGLDGVLEWFSDAAVAAPRVPRPAGPSAGRA